MRHLLLILCLVISTGVFSQEDEAPCAFQFDYATSEAKIIVEQLTARGTILQYDLDDHRTLILQDPATGSEFRLMAIMCEEYSVMAEISFNGLLTQPAVWEKNRPLIDILLHTFDELPYEKIIGLLQAPETDEYGYLFFESDDAHLSAVRYKELTDGGSFIQIFRERSK